MTSIPFGVDGMLVSRLGRDKATNSKREAQRFFPWTTWSHSDYFYCPNYTFPGMQACSNKTKLFAKTLKKERGSKTKQNLKKSHWTNYLKRLCRRLHDKVEKRVVPEQSKLG
jgi:hypothetical protein